MFPDPNISAYLKEKYFQKDAYNKGLIRNRDLTVPQEEVGSYHLFHQEKLQKGLRNLADM
jgi:hypothetical protein